jgi:hypothetical protein
MVTRRSLLVRLEHPPARHHAVVSERRHRPWQRQSEWDRARASACGDMAMAGQCSHKKRKNNPEFGARCSPHSDHGSPFIVRALCRDAVVDVHSPRKRRLKDSRHVRVSVDGVSCSKTLEAGRSPEAHCVKPSWGLCNIQYHCKHWEQTYITIGRRNGPSLHGDCSTSRRMPWHFCCRSQPICTSQTPLGSGVCEGGRGGGVH